MPTQSIYLDLLNKPRPATVILDDYLSGSINYLVKINMYTSDKPKEVNPVSIYLYAETMGEALKLVEEYFSVVLKKSVSSYRVIETKPLI